MSPTHSCGDLRAADAGTTAQLCGWVHRRRDHGGLIFVDLRDREGLTQIVFNPEDPSFAQAEHLRHEDVVCVRGGVRRRPAGTENSKLATGAIEVAAAALDVLNRSAVPPFGINVDEDVDEALRMQYRYLDLRRSRLQRNIILRHRIIKALRDYFDAHGFIDIETPMLIKSTPEGARDYLVPSRLHPGSFYALPQSPQLLKQILMIAGFGRYMQIARCMRDENPRADRQWEFTQLDIEMSFCTQEDVLRIMEGSMRHVWSNVLGIELPVFPRLTHAEALARYGSDKPDLRFSLELCNAGSIFAGTSFNVFASVLARDDGAIVALRYLGGGSLSRRDFDALTEIAKEFGAQGMVWIALATDGVRSSAAKFIGEREIERLKTLTGAQTGDALLLFAGERVHTLGVAGKMRNEIGQRCGLRDPEKFVFAWVTDFPYLEIDEQSGQPVPAHHPFTAPQDDQWELIDSEPRKMRAQHYDLVLNGWELGSGSIRIHKAELQRKIFAMLGMTPEQMEERFGFFLRALQYGAPPHGGMALGLDRVAMIAAGEDSIRDVIAFPKNQLGRDLMMDAPSLVPEQLLTDLAIKVIER